MCVRGLIAAAAVIGALPASAGQCPYWKIDGDYVIRQSNGIDVALHLERAGDKLTGQARFYSTQFHHDIAGPLEGHIDGDRMHFRVSWYLLQDTCLKYYGLIPVACWKDKYNENGIYEGTISARGEVQGSNYPFERPNARTDWFMKSELECGKIVMLPHGGIIKSPKPAPADGKSPQGTNMPPIALPPRDPAVLISGLPPATLMTGEFDSTFGRLKLADGSGNYDYNKGRIVISRIDGSVMEGIWEQSKSSQRCADGHYFGRFRFTFDADGFTGSYGYCDQSPIPSNVWNGTRI